MQELAFLGIEPMNRVFEERDDKKAIRGVQVEQIKRRLLRKGLFRRVRALLRNRVLLETSLLGIQDAGKKSIDVWKRGQDALYLINTSNIEEPPVGSSKVAYIGEIHNSDMSTINSFISDAMRHIQRFKDLDVYTEHPGLGVARALSEIMGAIA